MDDGCREEFSENPCAEHPEENLHETRRHSHAKRQSVGLEICGWIIASGLAKFRDTADGDDNQPGCRAFDRKDCITEERGQQAADNGGEDPGNGGIAACRSNAETQRQRNQKNEKPGKQIGFPGVPNPRQGSSGYFCFGRPHISTRPLSPKSLLTF